MLETHLKIADLCWSDHEFAPDHIDGDLARHLTGRFATAHHDGDHIVLTRDALGLNKLFFGYHPDRGVVAASYLIDLIHAGIPLPRIYSVPAGSVVTIDPHQRTSTTARFYALPATSGSNRPPADILTDVTTSLTTGFQRLAKAYPDAPIAVCLSGGADSALIALHATRHFPHVLAYSFTGMEGEPSEDATAAHQVARELGLEIRPVTADIDTIITSLQRALIYGQDWRDFNVHAAIVNDLLAAAIAADQVPTPGPVPVVLTGDLMNEFLGDYSPIPYAGATYYPLPQLSPDRLRIALTRGLQAGDREVGVFQAHGLHVAQPYGWAFPHLLALPDPVTKHEIMTVLAGTALPEQIVRRPKVRAQIGDHEARRGILPALLHAGYDNARLQHTFAGTHHVHDTRELHRFLRGGIYRPPLTHDR